MEQPKRGSAFQERSMASEPPERILRLKAVMERTGLSRSTLYRMIHQGTFPRQIRIAARCAGWRETAISKWLNDPLLYQEAE
jgi:prophage regulatory protein